jgi:hypothetical protein
MKPTRDVLARWARAGVGLKLRDGRLVYSAPRTAPADIRAEVRTYRDDLIVLLDPVALRAGWAIRVTQPISPSITVLLLWLAAERETWGAEERAMWDVLTNLSLLGRPRYIAQILAAHDVAQGGNPGDPSYAGDA